MVQQLGKPGERFVFIDALRAIMAVDVMVHHLYFMHDSVRDAMQSVLPAALRWPIEQDLQRVQVFFVISGFVIAWSLRNLAINAKGALNFILRRQIRLDPAYWTALSLSLACMILQAVFVDHSRWADVAGPKRFFLNVFYLQQIVNNPNVPMLYVTWTLCLEIQLYLVFILHLYFIQLLFRKSAWARNHVHWVYVGVILPVWLLSVKFHWHKGMGPWFLNCWYLFALGVFICWWMLRLVPTWVLLAAALLETAYAYGYHDPHVFWSVGIAGLIYMAIVMNGLTRWLGSRPIQFLGMISYSLFLVQWDVGRLVEGWGLHFTHDNPFWAIVWFFTAAAASIAAAYLLHRAVERPSIRLANRLKPRRPAPAIFETQPLAAVQTA